MIRSLADKRAERREQRRRTTSDTTEDHPMSIGQGLACLALAIAIAAMAGCEGAASYARNLPRAPEPQQTVEQICARQTGGWMSPPSEYCRAAVASALPCTTTTVAKEQPK